MRVSLASVPRRHMGIEDRQPSKIRIFLDPSKSDAELAKLIMEIARENFDLPEGGDEDEEDSSLDQ